MRKILSVYKITTNLTTYYNTYSQDTNTRSPFSPKTSDVVKVCSLLLFAVVAIKYGRIS